MQFMGVKALMNCLHMIFRWFKSIICVEGRMTMKKIFVVVLTLMIISSASLTAFGAIDTFYLKNNNEVYGFTMEDLIESINGDMVLWNYFNDSINNGDMALHAVHDDSSNKFIGFDQLVTAVNDGNDIIEFTEGFNGEQASMPQTVKEVKASNGEIVENEVSIGGGEVTGTVEKANNYPMFGMVTITVTLEGTDAPENYTVTIEGTEIPVKDGVHKITVASSDDLAKKTQEELQEALVISEIGQMEYLEVIGIE